MESALIVAGGEKSVAYLTEILAKAYIGNISVARSAGEARRILSMSDYDFCLINAPLPDEFGENLAITLAEQGLYEVLLIVKSELFDEISDKTEELGIIVIPRPINRDTLWSAIRMAKLAHRRLRMIQNENKKLLKKIEDIKLIDRAKCMLISYFSMTEPQAHKYIEKQAMDMRLPKRTVAEEILKTYEN